MASQMDFPLLNSKLIWSAIIVQPKVETNTFFGAIPILLYPLMNIMDLFRISVFPSCHFNNAKTFANE